MTAIVIPAAMELAMVVGLMPLHVPAAAAAQETSEDAQGDDFDSTKPLYQQRPFDVVVVKRDGSRHKILPLDLPVRKITPQKSGELRVRLMRDPTEERLIRWADIEKVELFEELVLAEGKRLTAAGEFDEAFRHFVFLLDHYPKTEGLEAAVQEYLFTRAEADVRAQRWTEACSALEDLYARNPQFVGASGRSVGSALSAVVGVILNDYIEREDYRSARPLLGRLEKQYGDERLPSLKEARDVLISKAEAKAAEVRRLLDQNQLEEAQVASRQMLRIWPKLPGGLDLAKEAARRFPIVTVGVAQRADAFDPGSIIDWPARRAGRLVSRTLVEYAGPGPEGGRYVTPFGPIERTDDYGQLVFHISAPSDPSVPHATAYDLSFRLLRLATPGDPDYLPAWADLAASVRAEGATRVEVNLRRPHVLAESLLRVPLASSDDPPPWFEAMQPYHLKEKKTDELLFVVNPQFAYKRPTQPAVVRERYYEDTTEAMQALQRGDILVLDRVFPSDAARLLEDSSQKAVVVRSYATPTLHLLIPNARHPYLDNATFRRALIHAIPREAILNRLLGGRTMAGCQVISGPFPAPRAPGDSMGYAYNEELLPRPFDPGVALLLIGMAKNQIAKEAEKKMSEPPPLEPLVIAFPEDATARFACTAIAEQFKLLQIPSRLKPLPAGKTNDPEGDFDLLYVAVTMYEPLADAAAILSRDGLARSKSPYINLALRRVAESTSWREVRQRLQTVHELAFSEATVIPLYQIVEHFAYSANVRGISPDTVQLYQDVERWQIEPVIPQE